MKRLSIRYVTGTGERTVDLHFLDWVAWEKHSGKSAVKGPDTLSDVGWLAWHACKRAGGESRPFEVWASDLVGFPTAEVTSDEDPTPPGA